jgi:hypothetical protein
MCRISELLIEKAACVVNKPSVSKGRLCRERDEEGKDEMLRLVFSYIILPASVQFIHSNRDVLPINDLVVF